MMRALSFAVGLALVGLASAAPPAEVEANIREAYARFRAEKPIAFRFIATERVGSVVSNITGTVRLLDLVSGGRRSILTEVTIVRDGSPLRRIVADGRAVWVYDYRSNTYSALAVDASRGAQVTTYVANVGNALGSFVPAVADDALRLAREINGDGSIPLYRPWLPGVPPADRPDLFAEFDLGGVNPRRVVFELDDSSGAIRLVRVYRDSTSGGRDLELSILPWSDPFDENSPSFVFVPPANARSVPPTRFYRT